MNQLGMLSFSVFFTFIHVEAQSASGGRYSHSQDVVANFEPSLAVVISILAFMFTLTFILLVYAKFCHRAELVHNNMQNQDGLAQSRSRFSGIDKTVIESLPFFRFSSLQGSKEGLECAVCLSSFEDIEVLRLLPKCKHAFHIGCVDQWLETHSSCPLCRHRVSADDLAFFAYSTSLRYLWNQSEVREDSDLELFVEREEDRHGSSRFSIWGSFKKSEMGKKEEELPIQEHCDSDDNQTNLHKFNHKIIVSDVIFRNRWSCVSSSDLMFLNSEMLNAMSSNRFSSLDSDFEQSPTAIGVEGGHIMRIKQEMERKRVFESKVSNQTDSLSALPNASDSKLNLSHASRIVNSNEQRSKSEIIIHPRFRDFGMKDSTKESSLPEINYVKDDRVRRLWLPIAQRTVQWFANRQTRSQQESQITRQTWNV